MRTKVIALFVSASLPFAVSVVHSAAHERFGAQSPTALYETRDPGQRLFVRQGCYQCHGLVGQGSILSGPALAPLRLDDAGFQAYVRDPKGAMPAYSRHILSDEDLGRIENYLRAIPRGRSYKAIPVLAALVTMAPAPSTDAEPSAGAGSTGDALYARNCAGCHGAAREGGVGPSLQDEGRKRSAAAIAQLIMNPPPGMPKLFPASLSRPQVDQVAAFVAK